jgi:hypothetical protein
MNQKEFAFHCRVVQMNRMHSFGAYFFVGDFSGNKGNPEVG